MNTYQVKKPTGTIRHHRNQRHYFQHVPKTNVLKTESGFRFEMAIPGIPKNEIDIQVEDQRLTIRHRASSDESIKYLRKGFDFSGFERSFELPKEIDGSAIEARFDSGILVLELPVSESAKPRTIAIQ